MSINVRSLAFAALPLVAAFGCIGPTDVTLPEDRERPPGSVTVNVSTNGPNPDPDGYTVSLDEALSSFVGANGSVSFNGLAARSYQATLGGLDGSCAVQGANPQTFTIQSGTNIDISFVVSCP